MKLQLRSAALGILLALVSSLAGAQYPARPVRLIVPLAAGGPSDAAARITGQALSQRIGQPIIIDNRAGADGAIAAELVMRAPPDGYTLFWGATSPIFGIPLLSKKPPYDPTTFSPISLIGRNTLFLYAHPGLPVKTVAELSDYARANPDKLYYATSTFGDVVSAAIYMKAAGITMTRVPYKGAAFAIPDLLAGRVQVAVAPASAGIPFVKDGRLRALAVFLPERSSTAPTVPTMGEAGIPGLNGFWSGIFGPPNIPRDIVERLNRDLNASLKQPEVRAQYEQLGTQVAGSTPQGLATLLKEELVRLGLIVREYRIAQE
jgi:tripartite-type tricarboxylate transporter receptor subunit TctC